MLKCAVTLSRGAKPAGYGGGQPIRFKKKSAKKPDGLWLELSFFLEKKKKRWKEHIYATVCSLLKHTHTRTHPKQNTSIDFFLSIPHLTLSPNLKLNRPLGTERERERLRVRTKCICKSGCVINVFFTLKSVFYSMNSWWFHFCCAIFVPWIPVSLSQPLPSCTVAPTDLPRS